MKFSLIFVACLIGISSAQTSFSFDDMMRNIQSQTKAMPTTNFGNTMQTQQRNMPMNQGMNNQAMSMNQGMNNQAMPMNQGMNNQAMPMNQGINNQAMPMNIGMNNQAMPMNQGINNQVMPTNRAMNNQAMPMNQDINNQAQQRSMPNNMNMQDQRSFMPTGNNNQRMAPVLPNQSPVFTISSERSISMCGPEGCNNHGDCRQDQTGQPKCFCNQFFTGVQCEIPLMNHGRGMVNIDDTPAINHADVSIAGTGCASHPCLNEGVCTPSGLSYSCKCPWGFTGVNCEICLTECSSNPCPQNKKCKAKYGGGFECVCPNDRTGANCEILNNACATSPCINGGLCKPVSGGTFTCECSKPWSGQRCEATFQNPCTEEVLRSPESLQFANPWDRHSYLICTDLNMYQAMPCSVGTYFNQNLHHCVPEGYDPPVCPSGFCKNDGECILDETNKPQCVCKKGFTGAQCETDIDECLLTGNSACRGGRCVDQINGYYCDCGANGIGLDCSSTIPVPCTVSALSQGQHFFTFPSPNGDAYVQCLDDQVFTVRKCAEGLFWHIEERTCTLDRPVSRLVGACSGNPCINGGECQDMGSNFRCVCKRGYTGQTCETVVNMCLSNPCQNGGKCLSYAGGYTCLCADKIVDDCCCTGIINPCPEKKSIIPGVNNYFAHLFPNKYIHCDFESRAFVRNCATGTRWNQASLTCLGPEEMERVASEAFPMPSADSSSSYGSSSSYNSYQSAPVAQAAPAPAPVPVPASSNYQSYQSYQSQTQPQPQPEPLPAAVSFPIPTPTNFPPALPPQRPERNYGAYIQQQPQPDIPAAAPAPLPVSTPAPFNFQSYQPQPQSEPLPAAVSFPIPTPTNFPPALPPQKPERNYGYRAQNLRAQRLPQNQNLYQNYYYL